MNEELNAKRRAYFREYRRRWREANRDKYLAMNKAVTVKRHEMKQRIADLELEVKTLKIERVGLIGELGEATAELYHLKAKRK